MTAVLVSGPHHCHGRVDPMGVVERQDSLDDGAAGLGRAGSVGAACVGAVRQSRSLRRIPGDGLSLHAVGSRVRRLSGAFQRGSGDANIVRLRRVSDFYRGGAQPIARRMDGFGDRHGCVVFFRAIATADHKNSGAEKVTARPLRTALALLAAMVVLGFDVRRRERARGIRATRRRHRVAGRFGFGRPLAVWSKTPAIVREFPLFGVGLGAWPEVFYRFSRRPGPTCSTMLRTTTISRCLSTSVWSASRCSHGLQFRLAARLR